MRNALDGGIAVLKPDARKFIQNVCWTLDHHLLQQERERNVLSVLASGASFEAWLAFETRIALESSPKMLPYEDFTVENERGKSDVYVSDWRSGLELCHALLEFKLVYNNKNWSAQVEGVLRDLYPVRLSKRLLRPAVPRVSIVGLIGKMYREGSRYAGPISDLKKWQGDVLVALKGHGARRAELVWSGTRMSLQHAWFEPDFANFFQLHAFTCG